MEFNPGDTVETTYSNITNKTGEVAVIYAEVIAIIDEHGNMSHHKKERLKVVKQSEDNSQQ